MRHRLLSAIWLLRYAVARAGTRYPLAGALSSALFARELRRFHDAVAATPLAGHYWVWGGLLLGWAREGRVLAHDTADADFGVLAQDAHLIEQAAPALAGAGFAPMFRYRNNQGQITEYTFLRHGAKFEFFVFFPARDGARTYYSYLDGCLELESELPAQQLESFEFLGRRWSKPKLHEQELSDIYGHWQVVNPNWSETDARSLVAQRPWSARDPIWR